MDDMASMFGGTVAGPTEEDHARMMRYMTQGKREAGPEARRAEAGMYAGPRSLTDDQLGEAMPARVSPLLSLLAMFGGRR